MHIVASCAACFWGACAAAGLPALPASAQTAAAPVQPAASAALQGATAALDQAHQAKNLTALNPFLTKQTAATLGFGLVLADSFLSGMTTALNPNEHSPQAASDKAFQAKVDALLTRYSLTSKTVQAADESDALPPGLALRGHQFLADALALSDAYEKSHVAGESKTFGAQFSGSDLPSSRQCAFHVLSPTRVQIVPRGKLQSPLEARLEDGQWRIDMADFDKKGDSPPAKPRPGTMTRQAAAFLQAVDDNNVAAVRRALQAAPALANTPPAFYHGNSGPISDLPLSLAAFHDNVPMAALLLGAGAKVDAADNFGDTALDQAAQFGSKAVAAVLLAHGASVTHKNDFGETPLHLAVQADEPDTAALLLAHGAEVNARDEHGKTPLAVALDSSNHSSDHAALLTLLHKHGAEK